MEINSVRKEGRRVRTLCPMNHVAVMIMPQRNDACNYIRDSFETSATDDYIFKKRAEGLKGFGIMHLIIAAYVRTVSQRPGINRFIRGLRIYSRNNIEIAMTIKKSLELNAPETVLKLEFEPDSTADDVYRIINEAVEKARTDDSDFDDTARILCSMPRFLLRFAVWLLRKLDFYMLLPRKLTRLSPFHGSMIITSMGSLGIPPIYHHIYNFGNLPVFISYGAKRSEAIVSQDGTVSDKKYIDYCVVTDERICDGHYFASALKYIKGIFNNPSVLDNPPDKVVKDID